MDSVSKKRALVELKRGVPSPPPPPPSTSSQGFTEMFDLLSKRPKLKASFSWSPRVRVRTLYVHDKANSQRVWAWHISKENSAPVRRLLDLPMKYKMRWVKECDLPRVLDETNKLVLKHPEITPGWYCLRGDVDNLLATLRDFKYYVNMGHFGPDLDFDFEKETVSTAAGCDAINAIKFKLGLDNHVDLTLNGSDDDKEEQEDDDDDKEK